MQMAHVISVNLSFSKQISNQITVVFAFESLNLPVKHLATLQILSKYCHLQHLKCVTCLSQSNTPV